MLEIRRISCNVAVGSLCPQMVNTNHQFNEMDIIIMSEPFLPFYCILLFFLFDLLDYMLTYSTNALVDTNIH